MQKLSLKRKKSYKTVTHTFNLQKSGYISNTEINTILKLSLDLRKPLLIEGPPGTGKTSLATAIAKALGWKLFRVQCFEGISFEQIIGEFDYKKQLLEIEIAKRVKNSSDVLSDIFSERFFIPRALYRSYILDEPNVLLIDEIDKAEEEFEAFLLEALGERQITVPEIGTIVQRNENLVIITSNAIREITETIRRRCLYLYIDFPTVDREREIVALHVGQALDKSLLEIIPKIVAEIRKVDLKKQPSISETIDWAKSLVTLGIKYIDEKSFKMTLPVLLKHQEDILLIERKINEILRKAKE